MKYNLSEYIDRLYSAAVKKTGDSYTAEEITQETLLAAYQSLSSGWEPDNLWAWLLRILSNKFSDKLREKYNKPTISFENYPVDIPDENDMLAETEERIETERRLNLLRRELGFLARTHREVLLRFYMRGESLEEISRGLRIPVGTVKSRLNTGKRYIREGIENMDDYVKQSYEPDRLGISCSGGCGTHDEPFSLVRDDEKLTQNLLILAYPKPVSETELAKMLGVPVVFIEPIIEKMIKGELMKRTDGGKVYTDFIIYTYEDRHATYKRQLELVDNHFELFWSVIEKALVELRGREYYKCQSEPAKHKLELHFCCKLQLSSSCSVRDEITGVMPYSEYPYRKDGGRWIAMGMKYASGDPNEDDQWKYSISGETGIEIKNFRDTRYIELRKYDTMLGGYPNRYFHDDYVKWLYEIAAEVPAEKSEVVHMTLGAADKLIESGILKKDGGLSLDIPLLTRPEYHDENKLSGEFAKPLADDIRGEYISLFDEGHVKLPPHLKSVPRWQQYMFCGGSVQMAVILKAIEKGLLFKGVDYKLPACVLVVDKTE